MTEDDPFLGREMHKGRQFSEHTMEVIDEEVNKILQEAAQKAFSLLSDRHRELDALSARLIKKEELDRHEIAEIIGPSVHSDRPALFPPKTDIATDPASESTAPENFEPTS